MQEQLVVIAVGFLLTTVAGGLLGYYFQQRSWKANRREQEREAAATVFGEISRVMDRRLYRMWRLVWALQEPEDEDRIKAALDGYREILAEWNDNLNRHLALAYRYFGTAAHTYLDVVLYEEFARVGRLIEGHLNIAASDEEIRELKEDLKALSDHVYNFDNQIIQLIQEGHVGLHQGDPVVGGAMWVRIGPGARGPQVAAWQRLLNDVRQAGLAIDGRFGAATTKATRGWMRALSRPIDDRVDGSIQFELGRKHWRSRSPGW